MCTSPYAMRYQYWDSNPETLIFNQECYHLQSYWCAAAKRNRTSFWIIPRSRNTSIRWQHEGCLSSGGLATTVWKVKPSVYLLPAPSATHPSSVSRGRGMQYYFLLSMSYCFSFWPRWLLVSSSVLLISQKSQGWARKKGKPAEAGFVVRLRAVSPSAS